MSLKSKLTAEEIKQLFYLVGQIGLIIDMVALFVLNLVRSERTAFVAILTFSVILNFFHFGWEWFLGWLGEQGEGGQFKPLVRNLWYLGFAITDFYMVRLAVKYCARHDLTKGEFGTLVLFSYLVVGFIQIARYLDRIILETDVLGAFYKSAIPTINSLVTIFVIIYLSLTLWSKYSPSTYKRCEAGYFKLKRWLALLVQGLLSRAKTQ